MILPFLFIGPTTKMGRGVFTNETIATQTLVEESSVIVMDGRERKLLDQTLLHDYIFEWGEDKSQCCIALGYGSIYNHSYQSNCEYEMDYEKQMIRIISTQQIEAGKELFINYNGDWDDTTSVWFDAQ